MSLKALFYAYVLGGFTFLPLVLVAAVFYTVYTSVPVGDPDPDKFRKRELGLRSQEEEEQEAATAAGDGVGVEQPAPPSASAGATGGEVHDLPRARKGWLTVRRTFEETAGDASYVEMVRGFLDGRSRDPKRSRPKDTWYVALKGKVLYLYEDEGMTECEAAIELGGHEVVVYPEGLMDGELFAKRNAICLKPRGRAGGMPSVTREMRMGSEGDAEDVVAGEDLKGENARQKQRARERLAEEERRREQARGQANDVSTPWFIFVRSAVEMEDWYLALVHASDQPANSPTLEPLKRVFVPEDMAHLVATLDEQPDVIPMRWLNALLGRIFFSYYRTQTLESYIIGRLMKKISKVKRPAFLTDINVREVSVGNRAPTLSKPMLKELTKEGDASLEVHVSYKGEVRVTVEATATINLGARFKTYVVKLVLALVVREIEGNLLVKVKRPPSSRIWYAFTQMPRIVMEVEPVVSDRQITWGMILSTIESKVKEVIYESVVLPSMDDISFFESFPYAHRGGIWSDASRHDRAPDTLDGQPSSESNSASTASSDTTQVDTSDSQTIPRSHSAEDIEKTPTGSSSDITPIARASTVDANPTANVGTPPSKRRPWFSGSQDEADIVSSPAPSISEAEERVTRGRKSLPAESISERHRSPSESASSPEDNHETVRPTEDIDDEQHLLPGPSNRRSASQNSRHPSSRATSVSSSRGSDYPDDVLDSQIATYRPKSPAPSGSSPRQTPTPNSPSSFFQTLKSRAADKQALSNTAKETMRKWGVNWSNFRRDTMGNPGAGNGNALTGDEVPDAGHGDARRIDSRTSSARPSYAEIRAAVDERREKDRAPSQDASSGSNQSASLPIPVPHEETGQEGALSVSPGHALLGASPASSRPVKAPEARSVTDSPMGMERTATQASASSHRSATHVFETTPEEGERPLVPIQTQPLPPKTMTIPSIHASHRGEVMALGYAPPPPPPPSHETKKAPLQSVYRLWRNPAAAPPQHSEPAPLTQTGFTGRDQDSDMQGGPVSIGEPELASQSSRPIPPPLPPRAHSTHVLLTKPEIARPSEAGSVSQASAALQSIVSKDRVKRASLTPPSSTPSSPGQDPERSGADDQASAVDKSDMGSADPSTMSSPPTPTPGSNDRGPPPALPPRRLRTST